MSIETMSVVLGLSMGRGNGSRKLVLLGYANHADKIGKNAHPSKNTIAAYCECDTRTVQRHVDWLVVRGYLCEGDQRYVDHLDPRRRPIVYDVAMSEDQIQTWATQAPHVGGIRERAADAGRVGGQITARMRWGDNSSGGDSSNMSGATDSAVRGDNRVAQTVLEPSSKPSSSSRAHDPRRGGRGGADQELVDALDVLPKAVRDHPSVIPSAVERQVQLLTERGWSREAVRARLAGVETANKPGAAALARLTDLTRLEPSSPRTPRPKWCGRCDERTRLREDDERDNLPYRCPACHPQIVSAGPV